MSLTLIKAFAPKEGAETDVASPFLNVSEFYADTIQGEGIFAGVPATFLRLQHCTLNCTFCDTDEVWREGNPYSINELIEIIRVNDLHYRFVNGQHLVITGGSPLLQQYNLIGLFEEYVNKFRKTPYIEIENECTIMPAKALTHYVSCWNNSPKLSSSGNSKTARYKPSVIQFLSSLENSWFKFVIASEDDWYEIVQDFLNPGLIQFSQILLMPMGATKAELEKTGPITAELVVKYGVRYAPRLHIDLWDKKTGV